MVLAPANSREGVRQRQALVHYFLRKDPREMTIDEFARCWGDVHFGMAFEGHLHFAEVKQED